MDESLCGIIFVDLIEDASVSISAFNAGFSLQEIFQNEGAVRTVNACEPCDESLLTECEIFSLAQNLPCLAIRIRGAAFVHH